MGKANGAKTTHIRNLIPRRQYKERGQLSSRVDQRGLLLEKKKDYKKRTLDFKQKREIVCKFSNKMLN